MDPGGEVWHRGQFHHQCPGDVSSRKSGLRQIQTRNNAPQGINEMKSVVTLSGINSDAHSAVIRADPEMSQVQPWEAQQVG